MKHELNFLDKDTQFYRFQDSRFGLNHILNEKDSEDELQEALSLLSQLGPDALLTMILRKWSVCLVLTYAFPHDNPYCQKASYNKFKVLAKLLYFVLFGLLCSSSFLFFLQPQSEESRGLGGYLRGAAPRQSCRSSLLFSQSQ